MSETAGRPPDQHEAAWRKNYTIMLTLIGITGLVLLLLLVTVGVWWSNLRRSGVDTSRTQSVAGSADPSSLPAPHPVAVVRAQSERPDETILLPARPVRTAIPADRVSLTLSSPTAGRVSQILTPPGRSVRSGQVVARITTRVRVSRSEPAPPRSAADRRRPSAPARVRDEALRRVRQRLAQSQKSVATAENRLRELPTVHARARAAREAARQEAAEAEALVSQARADLAARDAALRESQRLYQAGAASRAEREEDAAARAAAAARLERVQERARAARGAAATATEAASRAEAALNAARNQLARARSDLQAARQAVRTAENAPAPPPEAAPPAPSAPSSRVLSSVQRLVDVRAPSSGEVTRVLAAVGASVSAGQPLVRMERARRTAGAASESPRRFLSEGTDARLSGVQEGIPAQLRLKDGTTVPASVREVSLRDDGRRVILELVAASPVPRSVDDEGLQAAITVPASETVVTVPARALQRAPSGAAVWVARPSSEGEAKPTWIAHRQPVKIGSTRQGKAEIRSGLTAGSRVIVAGMDTLREGQRVSVVPWSLP